MIVLLNFENMLMINAALAVHKQDNMKIAFPWQNNAAFSFLYQVGIIHCYFIRSTNDRGKELVK